MMELIDREKIKTIVCNITAEFDTETIHIDRVIDEIDNVPTVKAIPLAKVKQAREEIDSIVGSKGFDDYDYCSGLICARNILDKLLAESEE